MFFVVFGLIFLIGILLPATPASRQNMLTYKIQKDSLLKIVEQPRIIFVGGSNLVFGLDSKKVQKELQLNPVNAGLAINFGLIFMMDDILEYIKPGDCIVLAPEYQHYFGSNAYGGNDLLRLLMDTQKSGFTKLRKRHLPNLLKAIPAYFLGKFNPDQYFYNAENDVYSKYIFNEFGDSNFHLDLDQREFPLVNPLKGHVKSSVIDEILQFKKEVEKRKATLFVTYPGFQKSSFDLIKDEIDEVQLSLEKTDLSLLGTPENYIIPDSLMFDQIYHLSKKGIDLRTTQFIKDFKISGFKFKK